MSVAPFVLKKYNIIDKIASGGMAEIFLATSKESQFKNKFYVIKRVLPGLPNKSEYLVFLKDEAKAISLLDHHNIIGYHDFFYENEEFYLVMDFVNGKTLREFFSDLAKANQFLSIEYLLYIITEIAAGLDYAHRSYDHLVDKSLNLVHRDLNPQNIMVSYEGQIKIIDFGISKFDIREDFTKTGMLKGKFGYMSPEQVEGLEVDARTDIFALGILCWELLTNKRLFDGEDDFEKYNKIKNHQSISICEHNSLVSKELDKIITKALAPKADDRYQTASELRHDLNHYIFTRFPEFRPEHFHKIISQLYVNDFKASIEKMKKHFQTATDEEIMTHTMREDKTVVTPRASVAPVKVSAPTSAPVQSAPVLLPQQNASDGLEAELLNLQPAPILVSLGEKKRKRVPRVTAQEPARYRVQVGGIKSSALHSFMNSKTFDRLAYLVIFGGLSCAGFFSYELGYFHLAFNSLYHMLK